MAVIEIIDSRRLGTETCEFDVSARSGDAAMGETFCIEEAGSLWEYVIVSITERADFLTLGCPTWIPRNGDFIGVVVTTRPLNAPTRGRYRRLLPASLLA